MKKPTISLTIEENVAGTFVDSMFVNEAWKTLFFDGMFLDTGVKIVRCKGKPYYYLTNGKGTMKIVMKRKKTK